MRKVKVKKTENQLYKELYQCVGLINILFLINAIFNLIIFSKGYFYINGINIEDIYAVTRGVASNLYYGIGYSIIFVISSLVLVYFFMSYIRKDKDYCLISMILNVIVSFVYLFIIVFDSVCFCSYWPLVITIMLLLLWNAFYYVSYKNYFE
jgi:hypothetical protein